MSEESEIAIVLTNAPRLQRAFGRKWAALITLMSLYLVRRPPCLVGLVASFLFVAALALQVFLKLHG